MKPVFRLLRGARLIEPEKGIAVRTKGGISQAAGFARRIMDRYLGRGVYEFSSPSFVFADWFSEAQAEEKETLEKEMLRLLLLVRENGQTKQLPAVEKQVFLQLSSALHLYESRIAEVDVRLTALCEEALKKGREAAAYLQEKRQQERFLQVVHTLEQRVQTPKEMKGTPFVVRQFSAENSTALSDTTTKKAEQALPMQLRLNARFSPKMEEQALSRGKMPRYEERFRRAKAASSAFFRQVFSERLPLILFVEHLSSAEKIKLKQAFPQYFPAQEDAVNVLTAMPDEMWRAWKKEAMTLAAADRTLDVSRESARDGQALMQARAERQSVADKTAIAGDTSDVGMSMDAPQNHLNAGRSFVHSDVDAKAEAEGQTHALQSDYVKNTQQTARLMAVPLEANTSLPSSQTGALLTNVLAKKLAFVLTVAELAAEQRAVRDDRSADADAETAQARSDVFFASLREKLLREDIWTDDAQETPTALADYVDLTLLFSAQEKKDVLEASAQKKAIDRTAIADNTGSADTSMDVHQNHQNAERNSVHEDAEAGKEEVIEQAHALQTDGSREDTERNFVHGNAEVDRSKEAEQEHALQTDGLRENIERNFVHGNAEADKSETAEQVRTLHAEEEKAQWAEQRYQHWLEKLREVRQVVELAELVEEAYEQPALDFAQTKQVSEDTPAYALPSQFTKKRAEREAVYALPAQSSKKHEKNESAYVLSSQLVEKYAEPVSSYALSLQSAEKRAESEAVYALSSQSVEKHAEEAPTYTLSSQVEESHAGEVSTDTLLLQSVEKRANDALTYALPVQKEEQHEDVDKASLPQSETGLHAEKHAQLFALLKAVLPASVDAQLETELRARFDFAEQTKHAEQEDIRHTRQGNTRQKQFAEKVDEARDLKRAQQGKDAQLPNLHMDLYTDLHTDLHTGEEKQSAVAFTADVSLVQESNANAANQNSDARMAAVSLAQESHTSAEKLALDMPFADIDFAQKPHANVVKQNLDAFIADMSLAQESHTNAVKQISATGEKDASEQLIGRLALILTLASLEQAEARTFAGNSSRGQGLVHTDDKSTVLRHTDELQSAFAENGLAHQQSSEAVFDAHEAEASTHEEEVKKAEEVASAEKPERNVSVEDDTASMLPRQGAGILDEETATDAWNDLEAGTEFQHLKQPSEQAENLRQSEDWVRALQQTDTPTKSEMEVWLSDNRVSETDVQEFAGHVLQTERQTKTDAEAKQSDEFALQTESKQMVGWLTQEERIWQSDKQPKTEAEAKSPDGWLAQTADIQLLNHVRAEGDGGAAVPTMAGHLRNARVEGDSERSRMEQHAPLAAEQKLLDEKRKIAEANSETVRSLLDILAKKEERWADLETSALHILEDTNRANEEKQNGQILTHSKGAQQAREATQEVFNEGQEVQQIFAARVSAEIQQALSGRAAQRAHDGEQHARSEESAGTVLSSARQEQQEMVQREVPDAQNAAMLHKAQQEKTSVMQDEGTEQATDAAKIANSSLHWAEVYHIWKEQLGSALLQNKTDADVGNETMPTATTKVQNRALLQNLRQLMQTFAREEHFASVAFLLQQQSAELELAQLEADKQESDAARAEAEANKVLLGKLASDYVTKKAEFEQVLTEQFSDGVLPNGMQAVVGKQPFLTLLETADEETLHQTAQFLYEQPALALYTKGAENVQKEERKQWLEEVVASLEPKLWQELEQQLLQLQKTEQSSRETGKKQSDERAAYALAEGDKSAFIGESEKAHVPMRHAETSRRVIKETLLHLESPMAQTESGVEVQRHSVSDGALNTRTFENQTKGAVFAGASQEEQRNDTVFTETAHEKRVNDVALAEAAQEEALPTKEADMRAADSVKAQGIELVVSAEAKEVARDILQRYEAQKEALEQRLLAENGSIPETMQQMLGKMPLIELVQSSSEAANLLVEAMLETPELALYTKNWNLAEAAQGEGIAPDALAHVKPVKTVLTELIASLDAIEWQVLEKKLGERLSVRQASQRAELHSRQLQQSIRVMQEKRQTPQDFPLDTEAQPNGKTVSYKMGQAGEAGRFSALESHGEVVRAFGNAESFASADTAKTDLEERLEKTQILRFLYHENEDWLQESSRSAPALVMLLQRTLGIGRGEPEGLEAQRGKQQAGAANETASAGVQIAHSRTESDASMAAHRRQGAHQVLKNETQPKSETASEPQTEQLVFWQNDAAQRQMETMQLQKEQADWNTQPQTLEAKITKAAEAMQAAVHKEREPSAQPTVDLERTLWFAVPPAVDSEWAKNFEETLQLLSGENAGGDLQHLHTAQSQDPEQPQAHGAADAYADMRAVMEQSGIVYLVDGSKGARPRGLRTQDGAELCGYFFPDAAQVVSRPLPPRGTPSPASGAQEVLSALAEKQNLQEQAMDIRHTKDVMSRQRSMGAYEEQLEALRKRVEAQQEELVQLGQLKRQMNDPEQQRRMLDKVMVQLRRQLKLERLQRGRD